MKIDTIDLLKRIEQYGSNMLLILENGSEDAESFRERVKGLAQIFDDLIQLIPSEYIEFFQAFKGFCVKCEDTEFLVQNVDEMAASLALMSECLVEVIREYESKVKVCVCCGEQVIYEPLTSYYDEVGQRYGYVRKGKNETLNREEYLCPCCNASDRDRLIISFLEKIQLNKPAKAEKLLQIAPAKTIEHWINSNCMSITYHSTDLYMDGVTFKSDIQDMNQVSDESYDYFICSHVLEHVQDDRKAMRELNRILKKDGVGIFLVPLDLGVEHTDEEWGLSEEENWRRFGQGDHCRLYAKHELVERLKAAGFFVHELGKEYFGEEIFRQYGLTDTSVLYVLTKREGTIEKLLEEKRKEGRLEQPLVSVVLPCYNHAEYVEEAIESVLNQTYSNIEFLVGDDGSTDGTPDKIMQYKERITEMHLFEENKGQAIFPFLCSKAKGKYVAIMHSDDVWEPQKLEMQVAYMESHSECAACFTGAGTINHFGERSGRGIFEQQNMSKEEWMCYFIEHGNCLVHPSVLIYREIYQELCENPAARTFLQLPDFWLWINLVMDHEIYVIEKELVRFREHEQGANANSSAPSMENLSRFMVELNYMWYRLVKEMDNRKFAHFFRDKFVDEASCSDEELMCEKFFVLQGAQDGALRQAAIFYMYDIMQIPGMIDFMEARYHWGRAEVKKITAQIPYL